MKHTKEQVEAMANSIMKHFIPKDPNETTLSFHFTIPPSHNYKVNYERDVKGVWNFTDFEPDNAL